MITSGPLESVLEMPRRSQEGITADRVTSQSNRMRPSPPMPTGRSRRLRVSALVISFVLALVPVLAFGLANGGGDNGLPPARTEAYTPLSPFRLNNNVELQAAALTNGWPGSGTESDPIVISGYEIASPGSPAAVYIGNTTLHFSLTSCWIHGTALEGLRLLGVSNASVTSNVLSGITSGAFLSFTRNSTFADNTFTKCGVYGLHIQGCRTLTISNNTFDPTETGIAAETCVTDSILSNRFYNCTVAAIGLTGSTSMTLKGNLMTGCGIVISGQTRNHWTSQVIDGTNLVNGKAIYYASNVDLASAPADAGQVILGGSVNITVDGLMVDNASAAVQVGFCSNVTVENSRFVDDVTGVNIENSDHIVSFNNTFTRGATGIRIFLSHSLTVESNVISNSARAGIDISWSEGCAFTQNLMTNTGFLMDGGVLTQWTTHTIDLLNMVNGKPVLYTSGADFAYILATGFGQVMLADSQSATIAGADIRGTTSPIILGFCSSSIVTASNCSESEIGVQVIRSAGTVIDASSMWNNEYGISLAQSPGTVISNCELGDDPVAGIFAIQSSHMTTTNVEMYRSGFWLEGFVLDDFGSHSIGTDTLVNGKPVYYLVNQSGLTVPFPAGQVILVNSSDIVVEDQELSGSCIGVHINFSRNITVSNVTSRDNLDGLEMLQCTGSLVTNSTFTGNVYGIVADDSSGNEFRNNNVSGSSSWGFYISGTSSGNLVWNNTIAYNRGSSSVFDPLHIQAYDSGSGNGWNASTGGNYWSDWTTPDSNGDGFVDLPYFMDGSLEASDLLPLTHSPLVVIPEFGFVVGLALATVLTAIVFSFRTLRGRGGVRSRD